MLIKSKQKLFGGPVSNRNIIGKHEDIVVHFLCQTSFSLYISEIFGVVVTNDTCVPTLLVKQ